MSQKQKPRGNITDKQREALLVYARTGSLTDTAEELEISTSAVQDRIEYGRDKIDRMKDDLTWMVRNQLIDDLNADSDVYVMPDESDE